MSLLYAFVHTYINVKIVKERGEKDDENAFIT